MAQVPTYVTNAAGHVVKIGPGASIVEVTDTASGSRDKTLTVPANKIWYLYSVYASLVNNSTAGSRQVRLDARDGSNNILGAYPALNTQDDTGSTEHYMWAVTGDSLESVAGYHYIPLYPTVLPGGFDLRFYVASGGSDGDTITPRIVAVEYDAGP